MTLDFALGENADMIRDTTKRFATDKIAPLATKIDADDWFPREELWPAMGALGLHGLTVAQEDGGLGLGYLEHVVAVEEVSRASASIGLSYGAHSNLCVNQIARWASPEQKAKYLPKLISGEWCGTMNITEPQAGSEVGALRTKAEPNGDGSYAITGQKIYISWADNDFTENVCHLVLARLPDGVEGTKGISLFMVPKLMPNDDGTVGKHNDLRVVSLEHKMGLHGSPTAVMEYSGAKGWLVGAENGGMAAMFTMMNNARLGVGVQGLGAAEGAYQHALSYAMDRKQGKAGGSGAIIEHADVRRMLATMKADVFAARTIALMNAVAIDMASATGDDAWKSRAAFLTPIGKAFGTDVGIDVAGMGVQVHGGMGFIEETGAAQFSRDVRVTAIYEGTNGIQAMDLVARKMMDGGEAAFAILDEIEANADVAKASLPELAKAVWNAAETLRETTEWLVEQDMTDRFAGSVPYLRAFARVLGGHAHLAAAMAGDAGRLRLATLYIKRLLPEHASLLAHVREGGADLMAITVDDLLA